MQQFIAKFKDQIQGLLSGLDRVLLRGSLRPVDPNASLSAKDKRRLAIPAIPPSGAIIVCLNAPGPERAGIPGGSDG
jgi:hypothetical protein